MLGSVEVRSTTLTLAGTIRAISRFSRTPLLGISNRKRCREKKIFAKKRRYLFRTSRHATYLYSVEDGMQGFHIQTASVHAQVRRPEELSISGILHK